MTDCIAIAGCSSLVAPAVSPSLYLSPYVTPPRACLTSCPHICDEDGKVRRSVRMLMLRSTNQKQKHEWIKKLYRLFSFHQINNSGYQKRLADVPFSKKKNPPPSAFSLCGIVRTEKAGHMLNAKSTFRLPKRQSICTCKQNRNPFLHQRRTEDEFRPCVSIGVRDTNVVNENIVSGSKVVMQRCRWVLFLQTNRPRRLSGRSSVFSLVLQQRHHFFSNCFSKRFSSRPRFP
jgi:hypothetical protein